MLNRIVILFVVSFVAVPVIAQESDDGAATRKFAFRYGASVTGLEPGATARVWVPIARNNEHQNVEVTAISTPTTLEQFEDEAYGNRIGYFEVVVGEAGVFGFRVNYEVERSEASAFGGGDGLTDEEKENFLKANSLVPIDGRPVELLDGVELPADSSTEAGKALYEVVEQYMTYDKSQAGYGNGDSVWACDSKTGNCTDFHSVFISLARSQSIPARFEIGFPLPAESARGNIGGYHCWAWFHGESGWTPVDISEADKHPEMKDYYFGQLTQDRVSFSTGRDIVLVPEAAGEPLNYFVYPYVEVDGQPLGKENIVPDFFFENID
ncbi:MAG: transglutaminase domain-containing protein [Planctomycetota bacterium]